MIWHIIEFNRVFYLAGLLLCIDYIVNRFFESVVKMKSLGIIILAVLMPFSANAVLMLSPGSEIASGNQTGQNQIDTAISGIVDPTTELYKQNVGGPEEGSAAGWYTTVFSNTPGDPSDATITWDGGAFITDATHLLVKDGNQDPAWYLFAINWDGMDTISLTNFWPNGGAISHVTIYGSADVPEPGSLALLGLGLLGLYGASRRKA